MRCPRPRCPPETLNAAISPHHGRPSLGQVFSMKSQRARDRRAHSFGQSGPRSAAPIANVFPPVERWNSEISCGQRTEIRLSRSFCCVTRENILAHRCDTARAWNVLKSLRAA